MFSNRWSPTVVSAMLALCLCALAVPVLAQEASPTLPAASMPAPSASLAEGSPATASGSPAALTREAFHDAMRKLWEDHITWTRLFIVSKATVKQDLPDLKVTTDRLLQNQVDIGNAVKPFYGDAGGEQLTKLLTAHIATAADLVAAAKAGDQAAAKKADDAWYANANDIAAFLNSANPDNWPLPDMQAMMKEHLDLTEKEATDQIQGHYADSVMDYDNVHAQILQMADMLSSGIEAQFPDQFSD